jgi:hypothetical protein
LKQNKGIDLTKNEFASFISSVVSKGEKEEVVILILFYQPIVFK